MSHLDLDTQNKASSSVFDRNCTNDKCCQQLIKRTKSSCGYRHRYLVIHKTQLFFSLALSLTILLGVSPVAYASVYPADIAGTVVLGSNQTVSQEAPNLEAEHGALMASDGKILWRRDSETQVPMASTTKIMSSLVALENGSLSDQVTVSENADSQEGSTAGIVAGDTVTLENLIYGMMLPSGNDAAMAVAEHFGSGDSQAFVSMMNDKAQELGMSNTHYTSPNGLVDEGNYTTADDYLKLVSAAMANSDFRTVVSKKSYTYTSLNNKVTTTLQSTNELLDSYEGANGIKTGFTDAAGYCFVGSAARDDVELYAVVFNSTTANSRFTDAEALLNWGFSHYHKITLATSEEKVGEAVATSWLDKTVPVAPESDVSALLFDYDSDLTQTVSLENRDGKIESGTQMGTMTWTRGEEEIASVNLVATETIEAPSFLESIQIGWCRFASIFTGDNVSVEQKVLVGSTFPLISATQ